MFDSLIAASAIKESIRLFLSNGYFILLFGVNYITQENLNDCTGYTDELQVFWRWYIFRFPNNQYR